MWYLLVVVAHPDFKRPCSETSLQFFETEDEAKKELKKSKIQFINGFACLSEDLTIDSDDSLIDLIFNRENDCETFYRDSYMHMEPFQYSICEVSVDKKVNM
jgi:hypothetical protein